MDRRNFLQGVLALPIGMTVKDLAAAPPNIVEQQLVIPPPERRIVIPTIELAKPSGPGLYLNGVHLVNNFTLTRHADIQDITTFKESERKFIVGPNPRFTIDSPDIQVVETSYSWNDKSRVRELHIRVFE